MSEQVALPGMAVDQFPWVALETIKLRDGRRITLRNHLVDDADSLTAMVEALKFAPKIVYDSETTGLWPHLGGRICGHAFACWSNATTIDAWYIPVRHIGPANVDATQLAPEDAAQGVEPALGFENGICGLHHAKFDQGHLRSDGVFIKREIHDVAVRANIHNENEKTFKLKVLGEKYAYEGASTEEKVLADWMRKDARKLKLRYKKPDRDSDPNGIGEPTYLERFGFSRTPINLCGLYACHDVLITLLLLDYYEPTVREFDRVYRREMKCAKILHEMEWHGIPADAELIRRTHELVKAECAHWLKNLRAAVDDPEFTGNDSELKVLFYEKWKIDPPKYTKGKQPSVDKETREIIARAYPAHADVMAALQRYAQAKKILSTYSASFIRFLTPEGRIHPSYNQLEGRDEGGFPVTGRLSSSDPNIQNVNKKLLHLYYCKCEKCSPDDVGDSAIVNIRAYFTVPEGHIRVWIDWSQIELRGLAWFSQDAKLLDCYANDRDVHQMIADSVCDGDRDIAKQVNFGNGYGMTEHGLSRRIRWIDPATGKKMRYVDDPEEALSRAAVVMDGYFKWLSGIPVFKRNFAATMRANRCMFVNPFGRPRRIPELNWKDKAWREKGERKMMSSIISGTCADLMKEAMIRCWDIVESSDNDGRLVQSIHDELVFDLRLQPGWANLVLQLVHAMTDFPMFPAKGVPIKVSVEMSTKTWADKRTIEITDGGFRWKQ